MPAPDPETLRARRAVPSRPDAEQRERLRQLLNSRKWVFRGDWEPWLKGERPDAPYPVTELTRDDCIASESWLRQQRHALYQVLEGGQKAPAGWLESKPLTQALNEECRRRR